MTRKAPSGKRHAPCVSHVAHPAGPGGWLCITTRAEDPSWPPFRGIGPSLPRTVAPVDRESDMVTFADHIASGHLSHLTAFGSDRTYCGRAWTADSSDRDVTCPSCRTAYAAGRHPRAVKP